MLNSTILNVKVAALKYSIYFIAANALCSTKAISIQQQYKLSSVASMVNLAWT